MRQGKKVKGNEQVVGERPAITIQGAVWPRKIHVRKKPCPKPVGHQLLGPAIIKKTRKLQD